MACKIFISTSGNETWTTLFKDVLQRYFGWTGDEVYYYPGHPGELISDSVTHALDEAGIFLCLLTDAYFTSPYCVREHRYFWQNGLSRQYMYTVGTVALKEWPDTKVAFQEAKLKQVTAEIESGDDPDCDDLRTHAKVWLPWVVGAQFFDLRESYACDVTTDLKLRELFERLKKDIDDSLQARDKARTDPERRALRKAAYLSAFALAADRYYEGGWGFSTGEDFSFDDDGDELVRGRYDLNIVILRALMTFLEQPVVEAELTAALKEELSERKRNVKDRLPALARFLAFFEGASVYRNLVMTKARDSAGEGATVFKDFVMTQVHAIATELISDVPGVRWVLDAKAADKDASHRVVLHEFVYQSGSFGQAYKTFFEALATLGLDEEKIERKVESLGEFVRSWLTDTNIFRDCLQPHGIFKRAARVRDLKSRTVNAGLWALLAGSGRGRGLISNELSYTGFGRWTVRDFPAFIADVEAALNDPARSNDALLFALACTYVLYQVAKDTPQVFDAHVTGLRAILARALGSEQGPALVLQLNSLGWALTILLADDVLSAGGKSRGFDLARMTELWRRGRQLREKRVNALRIGSVAELKAKNLQTVVDAQIDALVADTDIAGALLDGAADPATAATSLKGALHNARFWGPAPVPEEPPPADASTCVSGLLMVLSPSGSVDVENEGYNDLFLAPFSRLTGMNVNDLLSYRRELGQQDRALVEKMGAVVVDECFQRVGNRFVSSGDDGFTKRTAFITQKLSEENWPRRLGFDDVLKLRSGYEPPPSEQSRSGEQRPEFRWVHRTALLQPDHATRTPSDPSDPSKAPQRTIAWYFVEMPDAVARQLVGNA